LALSRILQPAFYLGFVTHWAKKAVSPRRLRRGWPSTLADNEELNMIRKIATAAGYVDDQRKAVEFWTKQVGFKVHREKPMGRLSPRR
jgi:hypothetical protein